MANYKKEYPGSLPTYRLPSKQNLEVDNSIFLPTCCLPKTGQPKKTRFIGNREKAVHKEMRTQVNEDFQKKSSKLIKLNTGLGVLTAKGSVGKAVQRHRKKN